MTINESISTIDARYPNNTPRSTKIQYLSRLDRLVSDKVMNKEFTPYTEDTDGNTKLLVDEPYTDIYVFWLQAWIDYWNGDYDKYNTAIMMYQSVYDAFAKDYNSKHSSSTTQFKFF